MLLCVCDNYLKRVRVRNVIGKKDRRDPELLPGILCITEASLCFMHGAHIRLWLRSEFQGNPNEISDLHSMLLEAFPGSTCSC